MEKICGKKSMSEGEAEATKRMLASIVDERRGSGRVEGGVRAAFPFTAGESWQISMMENEQNFVVVEQHDDGWTKIRKQDGSEGCVPADFLLT